MDRFADSEYTASEETSFGIMVLCDGIATPFTTDKTEDESILQIIPNENNKMIEVAISFIPIGTKGTHICYSVCGNIEFSNYSPTKSFIIQIN